MHFVITASGLLKSHCNSNLENFDSNIAGGVFNVGNPVFTCAIDVPVEMPSPVLPEGECNIWNANGSDNNDGSYSGNIVWLAMICLFYIL